MENPASLARRIREVFIDGEWIAQTNFKKALEDVNWKEAIYKIKDLNSLSDLCFHVSYYTEGFNQYFKENTFTIKDKFSFDYPSVNSEEDWYELKNNMITSAISFSDHAAALNSDRLDEVFVQENYGSLRRNIEAIIEHSYYHLGQVSLIKKLIINQKNQ